MPASQETLVKLKGLRHLGQRYRFSDRRTFDDPHRGQYGLPPNVVLRRMARILALEGTDSSMDIWDGRLVVSAH